MTSDVNVIEVLGHDLLLVETSGAEAHLASLCDGDDRRAAVKVAGAEYAELPEVIAGYDQAALYHERWSPKTLCGRGWVEMAAGEGGTFRRWQVISLVPTCRSCLRVIDTWFAPVEAPDGMDLLASVVADTVETFGCSRVVGAPVEHVEALRRAIRKHLRARGYRSETHHVNAVVHVFSEDAHAGIAPDVLAQRDREVAARIGQIISGVAREPARLQDQPDVVLWSTWVLDL